MDDFWPEIFVLKESINIRRVENVLVAYNSLYKNMTVTNVSEEGFWYNV